MNNDPLADRIVDATLAMAEERTWEGVRLRVVAERLDVSLTEVLARFRDLDAVADAWFRRAWEAMLAERPDGFTERSPAERIETLLMRWFDALAPYRRVTGQMLAAKLYPSHPHHWVPLIFNLSRTIQWLRDAAGLDARSRQRQIEETCLTGLFLATLWVWLNDDTAEQRRTQEFLRRRLACLQTRRTGRS